jgi:TPR repeat protein
MISVMIRWISCWLGFFVFAFPILAENPSKNAGDLYLEGWKLALGEGCQIDMIRAKELYRKAADLGDPRALAWKARSIFRGDNGFSKNEAEARKIFQEIEPRLREMGLNKQGDALGSLCRTLATMDPKARGQEAFELAQKNAIAGKASDWGTLGWFFHVGIGVAKDEKEAVKWYEKAAEKGDGWSKSKLGNCYVNGTGVEKDYKKAFEWFRKGAEQGDGFATANMGWCYQTGNGVAKDEKEAVKWYTKSADQGNEAGQRHLGWCYANGTGVAKDEKEAVKWYTKSAEQGDEVGRRLLGWCYANGTGVAKDDKEAVKWYTKSAEQGEATGQRLLGWCYGNGIGVEKDYKKALEWYRKGAEQGDGPATGNVGWCYQTGNGVAKDEKEAVKWYTKAAEKGDGWSQNKLGNCYVNGSGVEKDYKKAYEWYRKGAEQGDGPATGSVGWCYETGNGVVKDDKEAVKWYGKAAEKGDGWSQNKLGNCYANGTGVEKDYKKAFEWYRKGAEQGDGFATANMGWCYETGNGVAKDEKEAVKWYTKAADQGNGWSQNKLGNCYANGIGVEKDYKKAFEWYRKGAEQGDGSATGSVGWCYETGNGVPKDEKEAVKWYGKASEKGDGWAQNKLGYCYANGVGVEKDYKKAFEWYRKAADKENSDALGSVGWCYQTGKGVAKDEKEAVKWYIQAAKKQNTWAQKSLMAMGSIAFWENNYAMAAKCFEAAENLGIKGAGEELYQLDVELRKRWEGADPRRGILAKRKAVKGQDNENSETARLAAQLLSFGYPVEAKKMVQEAIENARWVTSDEELAKWHTLAGFCEMADPEVDRKALVSDHAEGWGRWFKPEFAQVGLGTFAFNVGNPQLGLDVQFVSDFISPSEPRRWASLFMAQSGWGLKLWQEQSTGWYSRLARAATASSEKGIDYLWATQNLMNPSQAKESLEKATKLFPNFSAWAGLAMLAKQEGDAFGQKKAVEEMKNILTESAIRESEKASKATSGKVAKGQPENATKAKTEKAKARRNKVFEELANSGKLPWGNEKGKLSFGYGYGGGPGLFHAGLLASGAKLFIPLLLNVKPDLLMYLYDMSMQSGALSPYQLAPLYETLTEKPSTRKGAISRLVQIHRHLEDKEETLRWALCAAEASPQDLQTLETAAWVAQWAGESEKAQDFSRKIDKEKERARSESVGSPQDEYLLIYQRINEADRHFHAKEIDKARHLYENSLEGLEKIQKKHPDWEPSIIRYRIKYLEEKLDEIDLRGEKE